MRGREGSERERKRRESKEERGPREGAKKGVPRGKTAKMAGFSRKER